MLGFKKIGLALAFSPTAENMLLEAFRLVQLLGGNLVVIHVGPRTLESEDKIKALLKNTGVTADHIAWEAGEPVKAILRACHKEQLDLLITGAIKKENLVQYYVGSIARKLLRKAPCSVLTLVNPAQSKNIVVNAEDSSFIMDAITIACHLAQKENASWVHIVRELKLYGLTMAASDQLNEEEYDDMRHKLVKEEIDKVEALLGRIPHEKIKINIKILSGKSGYELLKFTEKKQADLLIIGAPSRRFSFFDRVFPHDQEYIFANLPCNVLMVHPRNGHQRKEAFHG
jgi:nucleotide-binding universal stress UspA family protein